MNTPTVVVLMGVSGVGKTAVGRRVADWLGWQFFDADDLHPPANVAKMQRGEGLTDADREPWLRSVRRLIEECLVAEAPAVLACSALKASYRTRLRGSDMRVAIVWLDAPRPVIADRLAARQGHFAGPSLLASQLGTLEPPTPSEALRIPAEGSETAVARALIEGLGLKGPAA